MLSLHRVSFATVAYALILLLCLSRPVFPKQIGCVSQCVKQKPTTSLRYIRLSIMAKELNYPITIG